MKKNYALIVIVFLCSILFSFGQGSETFTNLNASSTGYVNGSYVGDNGVTWTYDGARTVNTTYNITSRSIGFGPTSAGTRNVTATSDTNGVGDISYSVRSYFTGGTAANRSIEVYVNGVLYDSFTLTAMTTVFSRTITANETGAVSIEFRSTGSRQIVLDDVSWTADAPPTTTQVEFVSATSSLLENGVSINVCVSILNENIIPSFVDITLYPSSTAINGTDYDDGAGSPMAISFPQTLTFPPNDGTNQCLTIFISNDDLIYEGDETVILNLSNPTGGDSISLGGQTQHILTIVDDETPVIADVMITEIMYNTISADDEWIEICNLTGFAQILNDYTVRVNGTIRFTFPSTGSTIAAGDCITISLGDSGDATYNPGCPFTPDYTTGLGSGILSNTSATITIIADDGTTTVDSVFYDDGDGADGNGTSLHVTDDSLDNSNTNTNWQEVIDAGSPGFNSLISQCSTIEPEINVEGDINTYPNISDGSNSPNFFDNTKFSSLDISGASETKSFRIQNIGTADLIVSNIEIIGVAAGDFSITLPSPLPITIEDISTMTNVEVFDVTFDPTVVGVRDATVRITNNDLADGEGEEVFEFAIQGEGFCTSAVNIVTPLSGPDFTTVTISGSDLGGTTSVTFAGSLIAHTVISPTEIEIIIPDNSISGSIIVTNNIGCQTTDLFTVIVNTISSCEGTSGLTPSDLFISEVTDAPSGSHTYIELFNGTGAAVDLTDYEIRIHNNGSSNAGGAIADLSGILADNTVYVVAIGGTDVNDPEGGHTADDFFGINGINNNDNIRLYTDDGTTETWIDVWGDTTGATFTAASSGYTYRRKNTGVTVPRTDNWGPTDNMQNDWDAFTPVDYTDIGLFDFSTGTPPIVTLEPIAPASACDLTASFTVAGMEGFTGPVPADTQDLAYQWFVSSPGSSGWTALTNVAPYSGVNTVTLNISNTIGLFNYQYYCQIREDTDTCYTASEAVRVTTRTTNWVGPGVGSWDNGTPDINTITVIDYDYDTGSEASFSACSLTINSGTLNIRNGDYVEVYNDLIIDGTLDIETEGSLIMIDDAGTVTNNGTTNVNKTTTVMETYDYTYWSSPVDYSSSGTAAQVVLGGFLSNRIYRFNTSQFSDLDADSFDDDQNSWTPHYFSLSNGVGYAAMTNGTGAHTRSITFNGRLNTGDISVPVALSQNGADANDDWNLLGNPYPSAIFVDDFVDHNTNLDGTVYLWTHEDDISISNPGPDAYNFNTNDYAMYNRVGGVGTASTGSPASSVPTGYIASGQGFFIDAITAGTIEFTNAMRDRTYSNNDFFRNSQANSSIIAEKDRMWINMTNPDGAFSQILIGYMDDGTLGKDRLYDGIRLEGSNYIDFYSKDATNLYKYGIQGRPSFTMEDIIPLGYDSSILGSLTISLFNTEGILSDVTVYLKDNLLNTIHNLTESDYTFATENGNFTERFEIIYQSEALSIGDDEISSKELTIIELQNGSVKFSVGNNLTFDTIEIIDVLGRTLYNFKGNSSTEIFELNNLSQTAYIAKVSLSNGQTLIKRAIKLK